MAVAVVLAVLFGIAAFAAAPIETVYQCTDANAHVRTDGVLDCRSWNPARKVIFAKLNDLE